MNKKNMFLAALCAISAMQVTLPAEPEQSPSKGWSKLCKTYATSLISGGLIGSATGLLSIKAIARSMNSINPSKIEAPEVIFGIVVPTIVLIAEYRLRSNLIDDINQNFQENEIQHNKNLLRDTAWITSWIAFLSCIK